MTLEESSLCTSLAHVHPSVLKAARERRLFPLFLVTVWGLMSTRLLSKGALAQDTPSFELRDGLLGMVSSPTTFKNAPEDADLSFEDFVSAQSTFLRILFEAGWGNHIVAMFDKLFGALKEHDMRLRSTGQCALVIYFATERCHFHDALLNRSKAPNISIVDEDKLWRIANDVITDAQEAALGQRYRTGNTVSSFVSNLFAFRLRQSSD